MDRFLRFCPPLLRAVFLSFCVLGLLLPDTGWGQTQILLDNFGTTAQNPISRTGWTANAASGSAWELRTTNQSSGYFWSNPTVNSSGDANVFTNLGANTNTKQLTYSNSLATVGYSTIVVRFGAIRSGTAPNLSVLYSTDGSTYTSAGSVTLTTSWAAYSVSLPTVAENVSNLRIRFEITANNNSSNNIRIDDFHVIGTTSSNKYWDVTAGASNGVGGTGTWGTTFSTTDTGDATLTTAGSGDNVFFQGTAGTVTLEASQTVNAMTFGVAGYTIATFGSGTRTLTGPITLNHSLTLSPISGSDLTLPGIISGTGGMTKTGAGTTILSAANTYSGGTTISVGTLSVAADNHTGTGNITLSGGTFSVSTGFSTNKIFTLTTSTTSTISVGTSQTLTLGAASNPITGAGNFIKAGAGTLVITNSTNYTGKTTITGGFISTTGESRFGANPGSFTADQITLNGGGISTNGGNIDFSSNRGVTLGASGGTFEPRSSNTITLTNVVTGTGSLTKTGTGTLVFAGEHTYTGTTTITAGTARLNAAERISNSSNMVLNGGTFSTGSSTGFSETVGTLNLAASSTIALGTGSHTLTFANSSAESWTGTTLTITGWTGTCGNSGTAGKIFFGNNNSGLTASQLSKITFSGFSGSKAVLLSTGELVPGCATSDIIHNTSFTEPSNIDYSLYQATDITAANSIEVASFTIQDGGGSSDADEFATTLSAITFSVSNSPNLRRIALYDGTTEIAEVAAAASVTFSSLSLAAPDNSSKNFSLRATFQSTVTDNAQFQFTVTSATAATGSGFATANAGGASSSTTGDRNRIEVTADRLVFTTQPSNTLVSTNMSPAVAVAARDANGNTDLDYSMAVTLSIGTGCGTLTGNTATPSSGVATFSSLQGTSAQTGATLTASSGSLTPATSNSFNFTSLSASLTTLVHWNFADGNNIADAGISANSSVTISSSGASGTIAYPRGQLASPDSCILNSNWDTLTGNWATGNISTVGYSSITVSSVQRGSNTGPRDWKLQYRIGSGLWTDVSGTDLTLTSTAWPRSPVSSEALVDVALPSACENISNLQLRWAIRSSTAVNGGSVGTGGTNALDEIYVKGVFISLASGLYYRSKSSGAFESSCNWETSLTGSDPWIQALVAPDFTAQNINILSGHTITVNSALTLDQLTVESGGTLELNNFAITWNNGTGVDFIVNGTYIDNASSAQNSIFSSGAKWQLGANGTFIKTRNSSSVIFRDSYEGGMSTIPATANWIIRYTGASDVAFTTVGGTYYPNLTFENASTTNPHTLLQTFLGSSDYATVKGNLDIGGTTYNSNGIQIRNINTNATPLTVLGNLIVRSGSKLENTNGSTSGTGFVVRGSTTVDGELNVAGTGTSGLLRLEGTSAQSISGSGTITLHDVTINNSAGVNLSRNLSVGGGLVLTAGTLGIGTHTLTYSGSSLTRTSGNLNASTGTLIFTNTSALTLPASVFSGNVNNLTLNGAGGVTLGSNTTLVGALTLTNGTLTVAGNTLTYSGSSITRTSGLLEASNSAATLAFANTSALTLPAGLFSANINNLTISGIGGITLGGNTTVASTLTLSSGNILTGSHYLELGTSTSQKGTLSRTAGYVVGNMRRWFSGTNSGDASGLFPMGNPDLFNRLIKVEFTAAPTTGGHLTVSLQNTAMGGAGLPISGIPAVGSCPTFNVTSTATEYWQLNNQSGALTDGNYTLTATAQNLTGVTSLCELRLLKRVGSGDWTAPGTHIEPTGSVSAPTIAASGISGFSNFGFGGLSGVNPLPLTLLSFIGEATEQGAQLRWRVTDVRDFSHYEIEKMAQGGFVAIAKVPHSNSGSPEMEFAYLDEDFAADSYYRLKMVDTDGSQSYSKVIFVKKSLESNLSAQFRLYPNPSSGSVSIKTNLNGAISVRVFDALGSYLGQKEGNTASVEQYLNEKINIAGLYLLQFEVEGKSLLIRFLRE